MSVYFSIIMCTHGMPPQDLRSYFGRVDVFIDAKHGPQVVRLGDDNAPGVRGTFRDDTLGSGQKKNGA